VGFLAEYLLEQSATVVLATDDLDDNADQLPTDDEAFRIEFLADQSIGDAESLPERLWTAYRGFRDTLARGAQLEADVVHFMSINRLELPLALATRRHRADSPPAVFGTLVSPY
jgi:hypothetical protein